MNACAWYSAIAGREVSPIECAAAFIPCDATQRNAFIVRDAANNAYTFKGTKDGRIIARKVGVQKFIQDDIAPILAAYVWNATDSGVYHIAYDDSAHRVTF